MSQVAWLSGAPLAGTGFNFFAAICDAIKTHLSTDGDGHITTAASLVDYLQSLGTTFRLDASMEPRAESKSRYPLVYITPVGFSTILSESRTVALVPRIRLIVFCGNADADVSQAQCLAVAGACTSILQQSVYGSSGDWCGYYILYAATVDTVSGDVESRPDSTAGWLSRIQLNVSFAYRETID